MFSDFEKNKKSQEGKGRMGVSLALSTLIYGLIAGGIAAAVATARVAIEKKEHDIDVQFAALPQMPKPKEQPKPVVKKETPKPVDADQGQKRNLNAPTEIPTEALSEANGGQLANAEAINIDDMLGQGGSGKKKSGPHQIKEEVTRPNFIGGCRAPDVPDAVRSTAETIRVRVRMLVMSDGNVAKAEMELSSPAIPDDSVIKCALAQRFEPARLPDGTAVPYPYRRQFTFKPSNI